MSNLLSLHLIPAHGRPTDIEYTKQIRPAVMKFVDTDPNRVNEYYNAWPADIVVLRDWSLSEQKSDMVADPVRTGKRHAQEWSERISRYNIPRERIYLCGINEPSVWDDMKVVPYTVAFLNRLSELGLHGLALNLSVGWPANTGANTPPDWSPFKEVEYAIKSGEHVLCVHEYWDDRGPDHMWGWWAGRVLKCPWNVPIIIGECGLDQYVSDPGVSLHSRGWQGQVSADAYEQQVQRYLKLMSEDKRVVGCTVFTTDYGSRDWQSFDTAPAAQRLQHVYVEAGSGSAVVPPVQPPVQPPTQPPAGVIPPGIKTQLIHPLAGVVAPITQHFGQNEENYRKFGLYGHNGVDFGIGVNTPVRALADGVVAWAGVDPLYGNYVRLYHESLRAHSFYAHLSNSTATVGAQCAAGAQIGFSGNTGNSTGPHLHLEVRLGNSVDNYSDKTPMPKGRVDPETFCAMNGLKL